MWELDCEENWGPKNWCFWTVVLEKSLESPLDCKEIQPVNPKGDKSWVFIGRMILNLKFQYLATWCEELPQWKRPWCWERLKAGGEGDDRGWNGWMPSPTGWTWVWPSSRRWWWTGKPGMLQSKGSQRLGHNWVTELHQASLSMPCFQQCLLMSLCHVLVNSHNTENFFIITFFFCNCLMNKKVYFSCLSQCKRWS